MTTIDTSIPGPFSEEDAANLTELTTFMQRLAVNSLSMGDIHVTANTTTAAALLDGITIVNGNAVGTLVPELVDFTTDDIQNVTDNLIQFSTEQAAASEVCEGDEQAGLRHMSLAFGTTAVMIAVAYLI